MEFVGLLIVVIAILVALKFFGFLLRNVMLVIILIGIFILYKNGYINF